MLNRLVRLVLFVSLLALTASGAHAAMKCHIGAKGGVNIADLGGEDADSFATDTRLGFMGGLFLQGDFSDNFGVRLEALYAMKGAKDDDPNNEATIKLDYIEFPILLVAQLPTSDTVTLSAFAGPVLGFNTNAEVEVEGEIFGIPVSGSADVGGYTADFEFGLALGAGANFDVGSVVIVLDGRYNLGLTTVDDTSDEEDVKNRGFAFMAGIGFPIGAAE